MNRSSLISLLLIAGLSTIVYINALDNGFHYDDEHYVLNNPFLEKWENIPAMFTTPRYYSNEKVFTGHYRPLLYITYALNKLTGGNNPIGYHIVNLAFHIGTAFIVFLIVQAMLGSNPPPPYPSPLEGEGKGGGAFFIALAAALIFAVHPFNSEVVNYITARSSVMSGFFYLLAFYCWVKYRGVAGITPTLSLPHRPPPIRDVIPECFYRGYGFKTRFPIKYFGNDIITNIFASKRYYIASLLAFLLGMLSKEVVITLPLILYIYDLYFVYLKEEGTPPVAGFKTRILRHIKGMYVYLPFIFSVLGPYLIVRKIHYNAFTISSFNRNIYMHLLTESRVLVKYMKMLLIPVDQSIYHHIKLSTSALNSKVLISITILCITGIVVFLLSRSRFIKWRTVSFFSVWFFVALLPTTVLPLNDIFQENRGYLAGVSFAVIVAMMIPPLLSSPFKGGRNKVGGWIVFLYLSLLIVVYSVATFKRNQVWQDDYTLWSDALAKYPGAYKPYYCLGQVYLERKDIDSALSHFKRAIELRPTYDEAYNKLGIIYGMKGEVERSMAMFKKAIEIRPKFSNAYYNLGTTYYLSNNIESAAENYKKALKIEPHYIETYLALAEVYKKRGDYGLAKEMYEKVINIKPSEARAYYRLGLIYEREGEKRLALNYYRYALKREPGLKDAKERIIRLGG